MAKKTQNKVQKKTPSCSFPIGKIILAFSVLAGLAAVLCYKMFMIPPDKPELDLNEWWGRYPMEDPKDDSVRPFRIEFSEPMIMDLRERLLHRGRFAPSLLDAGFKYGFNAEFLHRVLDYWHNSYNFKERENFLNKYQHYKTRIQGLDIHFMHVKPDLSPDVLVIPILLLHGWPGSVRDFYDMIPILTTPRSQEMASFTFALEIIAPSLPGFGFSQGASRPGFGPLQAAGVLHTLMKRIGHSKYYVHGGGTGHVVGSTLATMFPENVLGFHTNFPVLLFSPKAHLQVLLGSLWPSLLVEPELQDRLYPLSEHYSKHLEESGFLHIQATKPDTIGIALSDSPAGLAAYILEKYSTWTNSDYMKAADGKLLDKYHLTHLLDIVMMYWASHSITTSMRMHAETFNKKTFDMRLDDIPTPVMTWGIKFKHELMYHPDGILRRKYTNYLHSSVPDHGGHFAALELPEVLAEDIFNAITVFRVYNNDAKETAPAKSIYEFTVKDIKGRDVKLDKYKGQVLLIVNVASQCGLTDTNYRELNELHDKYGDKGLRILAFPCNQFGGQEPGGPNDIMKFTKNRGVKFDLFEKIEVNGDEAHPLWKYLKTVQKGTMGDYIKWNFSKFIVNKNGVPVARFGPNTNPADLEPYLVKEL